MIVKVCGMREANNIHALEQVGTELSSVDNQWAMEMIGFIFWKGSKRFVSKMPTYMPTQMKRVGVFVNEDIKQVRRIAEEYKLDYIQLHGHESPQYCEQMHGYRLIKAFNIASSEDLSQTSAYEGLADIFLFDTKGKSAGGNGSKFDWSILNRYQGSTPFLLSGGIGPEDAERVRGFSHPKCIGIDLNSRFETAPGIKDVTVLRDFITQLS